MFPTAPPRPDTRPPEAQDRDEVWDGVTHMAPMPNGMHQDFAGELYAFLLYNWARPRGGLVRQEVNLTTPQDEANWTKNYRIPDLVLVAADRRHIDKNEYMAGPPTAVVEVESPGDDTRAKLAFYAELGVPEVWVFGRDTLAVELRAPAAGGYALAAPDADGWRVSPATGVGFRPTGAGAVRARAGGRAERLPR